MQLKLIPAAERRFILAGAMRVCVGTHETEDRYIHWTMFKFSELPNDLVSCDDLERAGLVHLLEGRTVAQG